MSPLPVLLSFLIADATHRDLATGKFSVLGIFNVIGVATFPGQLPASPYVYIAMTETNGELPLKLRFRKLSDERCLLETPEFKMTCRDPLAVIELTVQLPPLALPEAGLYSLDLCVGETILGSRRLNVVTAPSAPSNKPPASV